MNRSHPTSSKFGKFYTPEEIHELFAPSQDAVDQVLAWLTSAGISSESIGQSVNKQWIQFDVHVEDAERLLKTKYHLWEHERSGTTNVACDEYSVPDEVRRHIDYVTPGRLLNSKLRWPTSDDLHRHQIAHVEWAYW